MKGEFLPDIGTCRLCGATTEQREFWREPYLGAGQSVRRCGHCAAIYLGPDLTPAALADFYGHTYRQLFVSEVMGPDPEAFFRQRCERQFADARVRRLLPALPPGAAVFELGSGFGSFLGCLASARADVRLTASEYDEGHRQQGCHGVAVTWIVSLDDIETPACFDAVVAFHVLEHLPRPMDFLAWAKRVLKPEGCLVIEVPDAGGSWPTRKLAHPAHLTYFTAASLERLLCAAGFEVEQCGAHPDGPPFAGTLRAVARPGKEARRPMTQASAGEIAAIDRWLDAAPWGIRERLRSHARQAVMAVLGPTRAGALARWLAYRKLRKAWHAVRPI